MVDGLRDGPAGGLEWDCRRTLAHAVDACNWYAGLLARAGDGDLEVAEMRRDASPGVLLDCLVSAGAVLDEWDGRTVPTWGGNLVE